MSKIDIQTITERETTRQSFDFEVQVGRENDELRRQLNTKIWSNIHYEKSTPTIEVPEFSGSYMQLISFKDLAKSEHKVERRSLVQHLSIGAKHYDLCWEIITQRYDSQRLQFTSFVNTMLNLPVIQHRENYNLKKMHDVITECLNGFANVGIETSTWDPLIVDLMSQKLDTSAYTDYVREQ
ncbi:unnamed protein product [Parnassius apollo]|uniref:(apollo) hypothetical protein n=1 Tax=Parnassius apollo TaxID=110799 RepID=A0A8S3XS52_PARAO|nr:unnamed protein product [Parnassius apollo]